MKSIRFALLLIAGLLLATTAQAHPGHGSEDFSYGFLHPVMGLDHLLAMLAVGVWAMQTGGRSLWVIPLSFLSMMLAGGLLGMQGPAIEMVELGIAGSVLVLGALILWSKRLPVAVSISLAGVFALCHGYAHGAEMQPDLGSTIYSAGFMVATAVLLGIGIAFSALATRGIAQMGMRITGGTVAVVGAAMLAGIV